MARPREFDEGKVLDKAMLQFWRHGYDGSSVQDLIDATGIGRQSLYNTFGDKHGLFLAALDRYQARTDELLAPLLAPDAGLQQVRDYVDAAIRLQRSSRCVGCLVVRSALEIGSSDRQIRAATSRTAKSVQRALAHALEGARASGELGGDARPADDLAAYVFGTLNGLAALLGTGATEAQLQSVIDMMFHSLEVAA